MPTDKDEQLEHLHDAVERKREEAEAASRANPRQGPPDDESGGSQRSLTEDGRAQDTAPDPRKTNTRHKQVTADKWNQ